MKILISLIFLFATMLQCRADDDYYYDDDEPDRDSSYGGSGGGGINPLAALIAPLAGLALLGAAAAVSINPVLVQLAVINGGRRKRRGLDGDKRLSELEVLESFLFKTTNFNEQTENLVANYLDCSGMTSKSNQCIERLVCIYAAPENTVSASKEERENFIPTSFKQVCGLITEDEDEIRRSIEQNFGWSLPAVSLPFLG